MEITNVDIGGVVIQDPVYRDEVLYLPAADSIAAGTILSRRKVATAVVAAAGADNTSGSGTVTLATVVGGPVVPLVGAYVLTCIAAVTNGGVFRLTDPTGAVVNPYIPLGTGAAGSIVVKTCGLQFTVTDAADFVVGDLFTLTVAADGRLRLFAPTEVGGAQEPCAILTYPVVSTGAAAIPIRALISGQVYKSRLVIDAGGSVTTEQIDALRSLGIIAEASVELSQYDNQ